MIHFKGCHFPKEIILMAIRWYIAHPLSYRHVEELMEERGLNLIMRQWIVGSSSILPLLNLSFGSSKSQSAKAGVYGCDRTKKASRSRLSLFKRGLRLLRRCCFLDNSTESLWLYSNWWVIRVVNSFLRIMLHTFGSQKKVAGGCLRDSTGIWKGHTNHPH